MRSFFFRFKRVFAILAAALVICIVYAFFSGVRFNPVQAAAWSQYVDKSSTLLGEAEVGSYRAFFYENEDEYRTVVVERFHPFWKLNGNSTWANKTDDRLKLVGWCSLNDKGKGVTAVPVQSFDENVAYIEMGKQEDSLRKEAPYGEVVVFAWDKGIRWNDLDAVAYSGDNEPLYKLGYEVINGTVYAGALRWLPVD